MPNHFDGATAFDDFDKSDPTRIFTGFSTFDPSQRDIATDAPS